jgi:hypothetical protein
MKRIVIMHKDKGRGEELASCLRMIFPECEIQVLREAGETKTRALTLKMEGGDHEDS